MVNKLGAHYPRLTALSHLTLFHCRLALHVHSFGSKQSNCQVYLSQGCWKRKSCTAFCCAPCAVTGRQLGKVRRTFKCIPVSRQTKISLRPPGQAFKLPTASSYLKTSTLSWNPFHSSGIQVPVTQAGVTEHVPFHSLDWLLPQWNGSCSLLLKKNNQIAAVRTSGKNNRSLKAKLT